MDEKDLIIQELRQKNAEIQAENISLKADVAGLLSQESGTWRCWACAHTYEAEPCKSRFRPCNAKWRGLENITSAGEHPHCFNEARKEI